MLMKFRRPLPGHYFSKRQNVLIKKFPGGAGEGGQSKKLGVRRLSPRKRLSAIAWQRYRSGQTGDRRKGSFDKKRLLMHQRIARVLHLASLRLQRANQQVQRQSDASGIGADEKLEVDTLDVWRRTECVKA